VVSRSEITTTVPTGATTGPVESDHPQGHAQSASGFRAHAMDGLERLKSKRKKAEMKMENQIEQHSATELDFEGAF